MLPTPVKPKVFFMLVLSSIQTFLSIFLNPNNGGGTIQNVYVQASSTILYPLFTLVQTGSYVNNAGENKSSLHTGSQYDTNTFIKLS